MTDLSHEPPRFPLGDSAAKVVTGWKELHSQWESRFNQLLELAQALRDEQEAVAVCERAIFAEIDRASREGKPSTVLPDLRVKLERAKAAAHPDDQQARLDVAERLVLEAEAAYRTYQRQHVVALSESLRPEAEQIQAAYEEQFEALLAIARRREAIRDRSLDVASEVTGPRPPMMPGHTIQPRPLKGFTQDDIDLSNPRRTPLLTEAQLERGRRHPADDSPVLELESERTFQTLEPPLPSSRPQLEDRLKMPVAVA